MHTTTRPSHVYSPLTHQHTHTLRDSQLALKHRRNKHGGQRIVVFVGSPVTAKDVVLKKLGNQLRKNNVTTTLRGVPTHTRVHTLNTHPRPLAAVPSQIAIDVICMGENEHNQPKVTVLVDAANSNDNR